MNGNKLPRVLDRNGREIKPGDRVRLINYKFVRALYEIYREDWKPEILERAALYGTATLNGYFQLADENGELLWDLQWSGKEPELEVMEDNQPTFGLSVRPTR